MKHIDLPCGRRAIVSDEDWPRVSKLSWSDRGNGYVRARFKKAAGGDGRFVYLHRFILSTPAGYVVDHIDGDTLNNTRENLQDTTNSRNCMRAARAKGGGVQRFRDKFRARIRVDGRQISLGVYTTRDEAQAVAAEARAIAWNDPDINQLATIL